MTCAKKIPRACVGRLPEVMCRLCRLDGHILDHRTLYDNPVKQPTEKTLWFNPGRSTVRPVRGLSTRRKWWRDLSEARRPKREFAAVSPVRKNVSRCGAKNALRTNILQELKFNCIQTQSPNQNGSSIKRSNVPEVRCEEILRQTLSPSRT